uniref:Gastrin-releasing peptide n=1 Tax=Oryzias latipes TaxID=8090 RepID=A0A3P9HRD3_ORYLA
NHQIKPSFLIQLSTFPFIMGGECICCAWICRPLWTLFILLAATPCFLHCSENPAAVGGKMYPRGNHWAVGHLMGKKSIMSLPDVQSKVVRISNRLDGALDAGNSAEQTTPERLHQLQSSIREELGIKYPTEVRLKIDPITRIVQSFKNMVTYFDSFIFCKTDDRPVSSGFEAPGPRLLLKGRTMKFKSGHQL